MSTPSDILLIAEIYKQGLPDGCRLRIELDSRSAADYRNIYANQRGCSVHVFSLYCQSVFSIPQVYDLPGGRAEVNSPDICIRIQDKACTTYSPFNDTPCSLISCLDEDHESYAERYGNKGRTLKQRQWSLLPRCLGPHWATLKVKSLLLYGTDALADEFITIFPIPRSAPVQAAPQHTLPPSHGENGARSRHRTMRAMDTGLPQLRINGERSLSQLFGALHRPANAIPDATRWIRQPWTATGCSKSPTTNPAARGQDCVKFPAHSMPIV